MTLRKRMRKAFTNGVLDAHRSRFPNPMMMDNEIRWAYEAGWREGRKAVEDNAARLRRTSTSGPTPSLSRRPMTPDSFLAEKRLP